jgi:two-component system OmpR family response regulator
MNDAIKILIVDDDAELRELLTARLAGYGFPACAVSGGEAMFAELATGNYDLILLDVMLPGEDGLGLCRRLRSPGSPHAHVPVIFLTALGEPADRIVGLELGGDDYLPKPFQTRELIARIRAVLRRSRPAGWPSGDAPEAANPPPDTPGWWLFGGWKFNAAARHLIDATELVIPLSHTEFRLLMLFLEHPLQVLSRDRIMEHTTGRNADVFDRSIDVQISRLRAKLRDNSKKPEIIRTMRGDGYMLALPVKRQ